MFSCGIGRLPAGTYGVELSLYNSKTGALLHRDGASHQHGISSMIVEEVSNRTLGACLKPGMTLVLRAQVRNAGEVTESGDVVCSLWHQESGSRVVELAEPFEKAEPGKELHATFRWKPAPFLEGTYRASFWVRSEGGTSPLRSLTVETCRPMELYAVPDADSYTQRQKAFVLLRAASGGETVAAANYTAQVRAPTGEELPCEIRAHPQEGAYFIHAFSPGDAEGIYTFSCRATASGYTSADTTCAVVLSRNPAVLWPDPDQTPADGQSEVTLSLGPVYRSHGWNPLINAYWDGRAHHGHDPIFGDSWQADPPIGWEAALDDNVVLTTVRNGTRATLIATAGSFTSADVDPATPGHQISLTDGVGTARLQAPTEPGNAMVLAVIASADALGFTTVRFTTEDPNENGHRWCVGDLVQVLRGAETAAYRPALDLTSDGVTDAADFAEARSRWTGLAPPVKAPDETGFCWVYLHGDWEEAAPNDEVLLSVDIRSGRAVSGVEVLIGYDPREVRVIGETPAGWFAQDSAVESLGPFDKWGTYRYGVVRTAPRDASAVGEGTVMDIKVRVIGTGDPGLVLQRAVVAAPDGSDIPVRIVTSVGGAGEGVTFLRGDANGSDGAVNIADGIYILQNLFASGPAISCPDAADANDDESVNIADAIYLLQNLFASGPPIPTPHPACGVDVTPNPDPRLPDLPACTYDQGLCNR
jgi:hypothetical protein